MESYHIHEGKLDDAVMVSANIPEFDDPYEIPEYSKRLNSTTHHILTAYDDHNPIAFKIAFMDKKIFHYVLRSFFLAAGKRILFSINRYPGEFLCKDRSVGGSPTKC